ncbi:MAG: FAD-dependent oxidoreductase [Desulfobacca sp.]|uniref:FAD-dependent oxidoreductase n=1 Tax=Desulfobacca sp. TaxID=2067990 RepID=UPI00404B2142
MTQSRPLESIAQPRVLVIGGGIAGIQAALNLSALGLRVILVEASPSLGGVMAQLDKTFPTNDCAMCILSPRLLEISRAPNIQLLTSSRVVHLAGTAGNFRVTVHQDPRYVDVNKCTGCGDCQRVCPVRIPDPYNVGLNTTKAIHLPFPQAVPLAAVIDRQACRILQGKKCGACVKACPAQAINFTAQPQERLLEVGAIIIATGATPATADVVWSPRQPNIVTSLEFERLLSATGPHQGLLRRPADGKIPSRLAFIQCVGSRDPRLGRRYCSAICCTASLKEAVIATELAGGNLAATIFYMDLRTSGKNFERYLDQAIRHGVRLCRSRVNRLQSEPSGDVTVCFTDAHGRPQTETFDMAILAVGLQPPADGASLAHAWGLPRNQHYFLATTPGSQILSPRSGIFLCGTTQEPMDIADTVTTAGAAAASVSQLLALADRRLEETPPVPRPTPADLQQPRIGVFLCHCGTNIAGVLDLTTLAAAVAQLPGVVHVEDELFACSLEATKHLADIIRAKHLNRIVVAACTPRTHEPVFREVIRAAGLNPGFVVMANIREQCAWVHQQEKDAALLKARHLIAMAVYQAACLEPLQVQSAVILPSALVIGGGVAGLTAALTLADQGFPCYLLERQAELGGLARHLKTSLTAPQPAQLLVDLISQVRRHPNITVLTNTELIRLTGFCGQFQSTAQQQTPTGPRHLQLQHGAIIVATGGREYQPHGRFLYGQDDRVLTQLDLEARLHAGSLTLPPAPAVIMIQCVGSREPEHPYCSRVCCATAIKNAILIKQYWPLADVVILYRDIRTYGFLEDAYLQAKEMNIRFLPYVPERPPRLTVGPRRRLQALVWDEILGSDLNLPADLVVLSTGIEPHPETASLAQLLGLPRSAEGFFMEAHQKLKPVETAVEGIFLCGMAHSPRRLPETISQAQAAAGAAARLLYQKSRWSGDLIANIQTGACRRCLGCLATCPVAAIHLRPDGKPAVQAHLCQGCGICAAQCPALAITLSRATAAEIAAQTAGLFAD